jgi:hypothetical protein
MDLKMINKEVMTGKNKNNQKSSQRVDSAKAGVMDHLIIKDKETKTVIVQTRG